MTPTPAALGGTAASASLDRGPLPEARDDEEADGSILVTPPPVAGEWQVACELKSGAALIFDRRSVRELGAVTLVRWAAPSDPRTQDQVFTALVSCREKTIEAAWPGKRSETRAGTCGRRLVEAVCPVSKPPSIHPSPRPAGRGPG
jgi:hypothetical protein